MQLEGKRVVITGGGKGIGAALARAFAREGARLLIGYRSSTQAATTLADELRRAGADVDIAQADVSSDASIGRIVQTASARFGAIDVWINNAGATDIMEGDFANASPAARLDRCLTVDLRGTILCSWAALEAMPKNGRSCIINTSWDAALIGQPMTLAGKDGHNSEIFGAVKGGVTGFTRNLARVVAPHVRVNEVAPGFIYAPVFDDPALAEFSAAITGSTPLARFGQVTDLVGAYLYLASDAAAFITGQTIKVNGGLSS